MSQAEVSLKSMVKSKSRAKKKSQVSYGVALIALIIVFGLYLSTIKSTLVLRWMFGIAFGFVLQRSRFCFTASMRDPVLTGSTSLSRAVIIAVLVAMIGFSSIQYAAYMAGDSIPGNISPVGLHTLIGGIIFGIGAVIAGGCASGTLMRVGEAYIMNILALVFFIIGSGLGAYSFGWIKDNLIRSSPKVFLPDVFGWPVAFFGQILVLCVLYWLAVRWEYRES